jgi:hypothetical protein
MQPSRRLKPAAKNLRESVESVVLIYFPRGGVATLEKVPAGQTRGFGFLQTLSFRKRHVGVEQSMVKEFYLPGDEPRGLLFIPRWRQDG